MNWVQRPLDVSVVASVCQTNANPVTILAKGSTGEKLTTTLELQLTAFTPEN